MLFFSPLNTVQDKKCVTHSTICPPSPALTLIQLKLVRQGAESNTFTLPDSEAARQRNTHTEKNTEECSGINYKIAFYCLSEKLCSCVNVACFSVTAA